jgi:hypothetical protein
MHTADDGCNTSSTDGDATGRSNKQQQDDSTEQTEQSHDQQYSSLTEQQLLSVLLFDLVLLEAWASSSTLQQQQQQEMSTAPGEALPCPQGSSSAQAVVAHAAAAAAEVIAQCVLSSMQQLLQAGPSPGLLADDDVAEQLLAVLQALLLLLDTPIPALDSSCAADVACISSAEGMLHAAVPSVKQLLLEALQLLVLTPGVVLDTQSAAVAALPSLLLQQQQQQDQLQQQVSRHVAVPACESLWQQVLDVLQAAGAVAAPAVRSAVVEAAAQLAQSLWLQGAHRPPNTTPTTITSSSSSSHMGNSQQDVSHSLLPQDPYQQSGAASVLKHLPVLLQLLMSRCSDLDAQVAAAAQKHTANMALPLYLLAAAGAPVEAATSSSSSSNAWLRAAALQPQQRGFKPAQLAQLFEQQMHASPLLLQRRHTPAAGQPGQPLQDQQQQLMQWHAQAEGLCRLARSLPVLPPGALGTATSSKSSRSSSSKGVVVTFESLDSAAVTAWLLLQEAARHCVSARLRTHLGNPTQSFNTLEKLLHSMLHKLRTDGSPAASQGAWQQQMQQQLQKLLPQQQQQQQGSGEGEQEGQQQQEPQQLLQTPAAGGRALSLYPAVAAAAVAAAASTGGSTRHSPHHQDAAYATDSSQAQQALEALRSVEQQRLESKAAAASLLDFMLALEVNMHAAAEGSAMRPAVGKAVMAFFAGNKKVRRQVDDVEAEVTAPLTECCAGATDLLTPHYGPASMCSAVLRCTTWPVLALAHATSDHVAFGIVLFLLLPYPCCSL